MPETITEANTRLMQFLLYYNKQPHRRESHSRIEDWLSNLTKDGIRQMCNWERYCTFAREPEKRKVGIDARITVEGVAYEVEPDLAGEKVILWWGLFDHELYVEYQDCRYGPYAPIGKPIPLHSYRSFKKTPTQKRADRIEALAEQLTLPPSAIGQVELPVVGENVIPFPVRSFVDPDPFQELTFKNAIEAKRAIARYLVKPLAKLTPQQMALVRSNGERLSVILAGHPKLKNDLRRPTLEEIGGRTQAFSIEGIRGHESEYIEWLLSKAAMEKVKPTDILEAETISYLAKRLSTPLQIEQYLTLAMNEAYEVGEKPITAGFMETVLAIGLDEIEPNLIRHGYNVKSIARLLNVRPSEVRSFLHNQLSDEKTTEMREQILKIGIPI